MGVIVKSPVQRFLPSPTERDDIYKRIRQDYEDTNDFFSKKLSQRLINYNFYRGRQWTAEEINEHIIQMRKPYVFNEIQNKIDHIIGSQTQTRLDAKAIPREIGDEAVTEMLTHLIKWAEQLNNFEYQETSVFTEGLVGGVGISQIRWGKEDVQYGFPIIEPVPVTEMTWDVNSRRLDFDDARWMSRRMVMSRMAAAEVFPEYIDVIEKAGLNEDIMPEDYLRAYVGEYSTDDGRKLISVVEHYEKVREYKYTVSDDIKNETRAFDNKQEAEGYYNALIEEYPKLDESLLLPDGTPRVALIQDLVDVVYQSIVIGREVVSYEKTALPFFPYDAFFCYYVEGDYWGYVEKLLDPQRLVNTFFSQWEYQLGAAGKNVTTVVSPLVGKLGAEYVRREMSRTAPVIEVKDHGALRQWPNNPVNPELYQGIMFGIERMMDYAGGKNALGLQENAAESGRAVIARAEQGGLARLPFFDKLRFWRISVTLKIVWYIKNFMTPGQIVRVIGADDDIAFVPVDEQLMATLREIKYDVIIDEVVKSESVKERQFQQMKELFGTIPGLPPEIISKILIEFSGLPQSKKQEIMSQLEFYQKYQQEKMEQAKQQKLEQQVTDSLIKKQLMETMQQQQELAEKEKEIDGQKKSVQAKLDKIEQARLALQEGNLSPEEIAQLQNNFHNKEELGQNVGLTQQSAMLK